eukprot:7821409-Karenia_brevis.AAC.1
MTGPVLRVIMNDQPTNATQRCIEGDISTLPTAGQWQNMALLENEIFLSSATDRKCFFYVFRLPKQWLS